MTFLPGGSRLIRAEPFFLPPIDGDPRTMDVVSRLVAAVLQVSGLGGPGGVLKTRMEDKALEVYGEL